MTIWLAAGAVLTATMVVLGVVASRGDVLERVAVLELAGTVATMALLLLAEGFDRDVYFEMAVVLAVVSFGASLVFVRFMERWV
jgi:multicomponent Na+:H+ antiporter subunit F